MVVVDRSGVMGASKYDKLTAADKLAKLFEAMQVSPAIPAKYTNIAGFAASRGWPDAPTALAEIRHGYVHANAKRRKIVLSAPNLATFEAWQLSMWYQELGLLFFLNHNGQYRNRVTASGPAKSKRCLGHRALRPVRSRVSVVRLQSQLAGKCLDKWRPVSASWCCRTM